MARALTSKTIVWVELVADALVAGVKLAAALFTSSASMAAEAVRSVVDVGSAGLMLYGYRRVKPQRPRGFREAAWTNPRRPAALTL
jgi:divalent metal cation (Fe/Co/Zn/Cd) transporter